MSRERLADAFDTAAEALAAVAHELRADSTTGAGRGPVPGAPPPPAPVDSQTTHVNAALGTCPVHRTAWSVRPAGVSKAGKSYNAFWKCDGKTDGVFCNQKPVKAWLDTHPPVYDLEDVPF